MFLEFAWNAWEKRKVSDYLCESRIPGSNGLKAKKLTVKLWGKGVVPKNETYSGSIKTKYYVRSANQLIYGKLDFLHAAFGIVPQSLDGWESTIDSPAFDVNTSIGNAAFLLALFLRPNFYLREGIRANGSRKAKRIHEDTFLSMSISAPQRKEQDQIAVVLDKTELLIAATQDKIDALEQAKKALLQRLFDQSWRFKGYSDPWEKRKYGDIAKSFQYGLNAPAKKFDGINKYLRITDIDDLTRLFKQESLTSPDTNLSNASTYLLKQGDVLFARTGASTGKTYKYRKGDGKVYFAGFLIRADLKPKFDSEFFYQTTLTDSFLDFVKVTSQRSGQPGINSKEYANKAIQVPELSEQQRIGSVLAIYDNLIAATQSRLSSLELLKKALLQDLFI